MANLTINKVEFENIVNVGLLNRFTIKGNGDFSNIESFTWYNDFDEPVTINSDLTVEKLKGLGTLTTSEEINIHINYTDVSESDYIYLKIRYKSNSESSTITSIASTTFKVQYYYFFSANYFYGIRPTEYLLSQNYYDTPLNNCVLVHNNEIPQITAQNGYTITSEDYEVTYIGDYENSFGCVGKLYWIYFKPLEYGETKGINIIAGNSLTSKQLICPIHAQIGLINNMRSYDSYTSFLSNFKKICNCLKSDENTPNIYINNELVENYEYYQNGIYFYYKNKHDETDPNFLDTYIKFAVTEEFTNIGSNIDFKIEVGDVSYTFDCRVNSTLSLDEFNDILNSPQIVLSSVKLNASTDGGTYPYTVIYYNAEVINEPIVNANWITIIENNRTTDIDNTTVEYTIRYENNDSYERKGTIIFSTNTANSTFTIEQEGLPMEENVTYLNVVPNFSSTLYRGTETVTQINVTKTTENTPVNFNVQVQVSPSIWSSNNDLIFTKVSTEYNDVNNNWNEYYFIEVPQYFDYDRVKIFASNSNSATNMLEMDVSTGLALVVNNYQFTADNISTGNYYLDRGTEIQLAYTCLFERVSNSRLYVGNNEILCSNFGGNDYIQAFIGTYTIPINYPKDVISIRLTDGVNSLDIPFHVNEFKSEIRINSISDIDQLEQEVEVDVEYIGALTINNPVVYVDGYVRTVQYSYINNKYTFLFEETNHDKDITIKFSMIDLNNKLITKSVSFKQLVDDNLIRPTVENGIVNPIWKDTTYNFDTDVAEFVIKMDDIILYRGRSHRKPNSLTNTIYVNNIIQNYLSTPDLPNSYNNFRGGYQRYELYEIVDGIEVARQIYYFINDWSYSNTDNINNFHCGVISHPIKDKVDAVATQYFPFSIFATDIPITVDIGYRVTDGIVADKVNPLRMQNTLYHDWGTTLKNVSDEIYFGRIGNIKINTFYQPCERRFVIYYVNAYGGYDWFIPKNNYLITDNINQYQYTKNYNNTTFEFGDMRYLTEIKKNYQFTTDYLNENESNRMFNLLESNKVYLHDLQENKIIPVLVTDTTVEYKRKDRNKIIQYTFNLQESQIKERQ